jgi:hypothetical protein
LIDLDDVLRDWTASPPANWDADAAKSVAAKLSRENDMEVDWDPPDEEWIRLGNPVQALVHVRYPLALVARELVDTVRAARPDLRIVAIADYYGEELRATTDVLKATVLPYQPWSEDFTADQFSAHDLFVESV